MNYYGFLFLAGVVIIAGLLGFGAIAIAASGLAKFLLSFFLILFLANLISHMGRGHRI